MAASRAPLRSALLLLACLALLGSAGQHRRVVSVADLHGDYERTVMLLAASEVLDPETLTWVGGNATLVQTGDIVDRGHDAKAIYELFFRLGEEAHAVGGSVVNLLGNHELMNLQGDVRYVTKEDYASFGGPRERAKAWAADGWLGKRIRAFPAVALEGGVLFSHAGVVPDLLHNSTGSEDASNSGLAGLNARMAQAVASLPGRGGDHVYLFGSKGPLWTRFYDDAAVNGRGEEMCAALQEVLDTVGAHRMVVGHSIQEFVKDGDCRVRHACGGRVVFADTAIASHYGGEASFVEHDGDGGATVVYPQLKERVPLPHPAHVALEEYASVDGFALVAADYASGVGPNKEGAANVEGAADADGNYSAKSEHVVEGDVVLDAIPAAENEVRAEL